jgi:hypothetical protein
MTVRDLNIINTEPYLTAKYWTLVLQDYKDAGKNQHPVAIAHVRSRILAHFRAMDVFDRIDIIQIRWWAANSFDVWSPELREVGC